MKIQFLTLLAQTSPDLPLDSLIAIAFLGKIGVLLGWSMVLLMAWKTWRREVPTRFGMVCVIGGIIIILLRPFVVPILFFLKGFPL